MSFKNGITPHEAFDLQQLLMMKNICATKSFAMSKLVRDEELKSIMLQDLAASKDHITELEALIQSSSSAAPDRFKAFKQVQTSRFASSNALDEVKDKEVPMQSGAKNRASGAKGVST